MCKFLHCIIPNQSKGRNIVEKNYLATCYKDMYYINNPHFNLSSSLSRFVFEVRITSVSCCLGLEVTIAIMGSITKYTIPSILTPLVSIALFNVQTFSDCFSTMSVTVVVLDSHIQQHTTHSTSIIKYKTA